MRYAIVIESTAFPSDRYAAESQLRLHGFDAEDALIEWSPRVGGSRLELADLEAILDRDSERIALMLLPGVQYYNGQVLDMSALCELARRHAVPERRRAIAQPHECPDRPRERLDLEPVLGARGPGLDRRQHARVVGRHEECKRHEQRRRVQGVGAIGLHVGAQSRAPAPRHDPRPGLGRASAGSRC